MSGAFKSGDNVQPRFGRLLRSVKKALQSCCPDTPDNARLGAVTFVHRLGSALNGNIHFDEILPCISHYVQLSAAQIRSRRICPLDCPQCGGELTIVAFLTESDLIQRLLFQLGEPVTPHQIALVRGPPEWLEADFDHTVPNDSEDTEPEPEFDKSVRKDDLHARRKAARRVVHKDAHHEFDQTVNETHQMRWKA